MRVLTELLSNDISETLSDHGTSWDCSWWLIAELLRYTLNIQYIKDILLNTDVRHPWTHFAVFVQTRWL